MALLCGLVACSPQKRLNRIVRNNPELIRIDTIRDTLTTPAVHIDTIVHYQTGDTIIIEKENVRTELIFLPGDSIKVNTDKAPDTVYFEKPVPVIQTNTDQLQEIEKELEKLKRNFWPFCSLLFVAGFICAAFIFRKK